MSLDEATLELGRRFGAELRRIREKKGLTVEAVQATTKAPKGVIEQFEASALLDYEMFNRVYLRSFVRSYAQALGLPVDDVLEALEEVFAGTYAGRLAVTYLEERPSTPPEEPLPGTAPPAEPGAPSREKVASEGEAAGEEEAPGPSEKEAAEASEPEASEPEASEPEASEPEASEPEASEPEASEPEALEPEVPPLDSSEDVTGAWKGESSLRREAAARSVRTGRGPYGRRAGALRSGAASGGGISWGIVIGAGVILLVVVAVLWFTSRSGPPPAEPAVPAPDTTAVEAPPAPEPIVLGDTMRVYVVAERGNLERLQVTVDDDLRRPYWIEEGDSMLFRPTDRIVFENPRALRRARIMLEGYPFAVAPQDRTSVVITRARAQAFLDSLSLTLPPSSDARP